MAEITPQFSEILAKALTFSARERVWLIDRLAASLGTARWFARIDEFAADPLHRGQQPMLGGSEAPRRRSRHRRG
jgi:hypothetical protein